MRTILLGAMLAVGIFDFYIAVYFVLFPSNAMQVFNVAADGFARHSTIGVQLAGVFLLSGFCLLAGIWRKNADLTVVPALLFGISFLVGAINQIVPYSLPAWWMPKTTDAIHLGWLHIILAVAAWRLLPHPRFYEVEA